jgi:hypothetical protein
MRHLALILVRVFLNKQFYVQMRHLALILVRVFLNKQFYVQMKHFLAVILVRVFLNKQFYVQMKHFLAVILVIEFLNKQFYVPDETLLSCDWKELSDNKFLRICRRKQRTGYICKFSYPSRYLSKSYYGYQLIKV